jgi:putative membrane protein
MKLLIFRVPIINYQEVDIAMEWEYLLHGIIDTAIYCLLGMVMMGLGVALVILVSPFSVKKEIEDDQNTSLAIIIGAIILGIAIIIAAVVSSPSGTYTSKKDKQKTEVKVE